jgi:hypothetical protein
MELSDHLDVFPLTPEERAEMEKEYTRLAKKAGLLKKAESVFKPKPSPKFYIV